jgi:hypothetical protein
MHGVFEGAAKMHGDCQPIKLLGNLRKMCRKVGGLKVLTRSEHGWLQNVVE